MNKIVFLLPYFGKLPDNFKLWLKSCKYNTSVDFIVITDDKTNYDYPSNVIVKYKTFDEIKKRIQDHFEFEVMIDRPWRLSLFKPAYGEIFEEEIEEYAFWGYCDADLMWGDISKFITDDLLEKYERIGTKGHASLYKNTKEVNSRYKTIVSDLANYKLVFSGKTEYSFDENGMDEIYDYLNIPYYFKPYFAHLEKYESSFYLKRIPKDKLYTNRYQLFLWNKGKLERMYIDGEKVYQEEYMYIHFFCRPMKYVVGEPSDSQYIIYPDIVKPFDETVSAELIKKHGKQCKLKFWIKMIWFNRKKITLKRISKNIKNMVSYRFKNE